MAVKNIACLKGPIFGLPCQSKVLLSAFSGPTEGHLFNAQKPKFGRIEKKTAMAFEIYVKKMHNYYQQW